MESAPPSTILHPEREICRKASAAADHSLGYSGTTCIALVHKDKFLYQHDGRATKHVKEHGTEVKINKVMDDKCPGKYFKLNNHIQTLIAGNVGDALRMIKHVGEKIRDKKIKDKHRSPVLAATLAVEYLQTSESSPIACIFMGSNASGRKLSIYTIEGGADVERKLRVEPRKYASDLPQVLKEGRFAAIGSGSSAARTYLSNKWANKDVDSLPQAEVVEDMCQAMMWASLDEPGTGGWTTVYQLNEGPQTAATKGSQTAPSTLAKRDSLNHGSETAAAGTILAKEKVIDLYQQFYDAYQEETESEERTLFVLWPQKTMTVCLHDTRSDNYFRGFGGISHSHTIGNVSGCQLYRYVFDEVAAAEKALKDLSERQSKIVKIEYVRNPEIGRLDVYESPPGVQSQRAYVGKASKELLGKLKQGEIEAKRVSVDAKLRKYRD